MFDINLYDNPEIFYPVYTIVIDMYKYLMRMFLFDIFHRRQNSLMHPT